MAKISKKSEKITPFGGIFHVREHFSRSVGPVIDKVLGLRCKSFGYQSARLWDLCQVSTSVARLCGGCDEPFDAPSLASSHSSHVQL